MDATHTVGAVREIVKEMERMKSDPASDDELKLAKNALTLSLPRLFETPSQVSRRVRQQVIYDLPDDFCETFPDEVRAVDRADVRRVADRILSTDRAVIVVVGPAADFRAELEELGRVEVRDAHGRPADL